MSTTTPRTTARLSALYAALTGFNEPQPIANLFFNVNWSLDLDDHFTTNDSLRAFIRANLPADCITKQGGRLLVGLRAFAQPEEIADALRARDGETYPILLSDATESELRRELWLQRDYALYQSLKWAEQSGVIEPVYGGVYGTMVRVARTAAPAMPEEPTPAMVDIEAQKAELGLFVPLPGTTIPVRIVGPLGPLEGEHVLWLKVVRAAGWRTWAVGNKEYRPAEYVEVLSNDAVLVLTDGHDSIEIETGRVNVHLGGDKFLFAGHNWLNDWRGAERAAVKRMIKRAQKARATQPAAA